MTGREALVEAILFLEGEPVELRTIERVTNLSREDVLSSLAAIKEHYDSAEHGVELIELAGGYALSPKAELAPALRERYGKRNEARLSRAALETLSIIAYSQPVTRGEVENLRGVSADGMIRLLLERELIREVGRKDGPGRPVQYGTTREFLKLFRLSSIAELPRLEEADEARFARKEG